MISRRARKSIQNGLEMTAQHNGVSVEEVRREIDLLIHTCMNSPNAIIRARWAAIPRSGEVPTVEKVMAYGVSRLLQDGKE